MGLIGMCVHASPVPCQGKHLLSNGTGKDFVPKPAVPHNAVA